MTVDAANPERCSSKPSASQTSLRQIDLAATLSLMMGVEIPYSNVGHVSADLWALTGGSDLGPLLAANAQQVRGRYVSEAGCVWVHRWHIGGNCPEKV